MNLEDLPKTDPQQALYFFFEPQGQTLFLAIFCSIKQKKKITKENLVCTYKYLKNENRPFHPYVNFHYHELFPYHKIVLTCMNCLQVLQSAAHSSHFRRCLDMNQKVNLKWKRMKPLTKKVRATWKNWNCTTLETSQTWFYQKPQMQIIHKRSNSL